MTAKQRRVEARSTGDPPRGTRAAGGRAWWPCRGRRPPARPAPPAPPRRPASPTATRCRRWSGPSLLLDKALPYDPANPALSDDPVFQLRTSLLESERYLLGAQYLEKWYPSRGPAVHRRAGPVHPGRAGVRDPPTGDGGAHRRHRGPDGRAQRRATGRSREDAIRYADLLVRSIACEHVAVTPGGWGASCQTAHWATLAGEAAWLIWDRLTPQTREYVAQMLAYEADDQTTAPGGVLGRRVRHRRLPRRHQGRERLVEQRGPRAGRVMMPTHPHAANWRRKAVDLEVAAYSRLSDINAPTVVNGVTLADRLDGANAYDDGTVENHHILHPDYMTNIQHNWWAIDFAGLAGRRPPASAVHNAALVYGAFTTLSFTAGRTVAGRRCAVRCARAARSIGRAATASTSRRAPTWGTVRRAPFISFDAHALRLRPGLDGRVVGPGRAEPAHGRSAGPGRQQRRPATAAPTATTRRPRTPRTRYNGREEYAASQLAAAWLALYVSRNAWDQTFNLPALDGATYAPLPPLTRSATGWSSVPHSTSPDEERRSP